MPRTVLLVGEAYGEEEERYGAPFIGASGKELNDQLEDAGFLPRGTADRLNRALYSAGIGGSFSSPDASKARWAIRLRDDTFKSCGLALANCVAKRPPGNKIEAFFFNKTDARKNNSTELNGRYPNDDLRSGVSHLRELIRTTRPNLIICLGNSPFWALTNKDGITRWRGSQIRYVGDDGYDCSLLPTLHPAAVLREWPWRPIVITDLKRAKHERDTRPSHPRWDFTVRPSFDVCMAYLNSLADGEGPLVSDTETAGGHITCIGFADSASRAICIPFLDPGRPDGNYWSSGDELSIVDAVKQVLKRRPIIFHNGLYDMQMISADWGFAPRWEHDTMVAQHVAFPGLLGAGLDPITGATSKRGSSLSLAFCASMYCAHYVFWKDDGRLWDPNVTPPDDFWRYNCEDCVRTYEVHEALQNILHEAGLLDQYHFQCKLLGPATLRLMQRGLALNHNLRTAQLKSVREGLTGCEAWFERVLGHPLNPQSNPQMKALFYEDLRCPLQWKGRGAERTLTCDDEALAKVASARSELAPLIRRISDYRTLAVLGGKASGPSKSLLTCRLDEDLRLRTTLSLCGAETFRYASGPTAHGTGCNLQNILKVKE